MSGAHTQDATDPRPMSRMGKAAAITALSLIGLLTLTALGALVIMQKHSIASGSMLPSLFVGEFVMFTPVAIAGAPEPGDVVTYRNIDTTWVSRVIAGPGDRVSMAKGVLRINDEVVGRRAAEPPAGMVPLEGGDLPVFQETLPNGRSYLVLDNPDAGPADNLAELTVPDGNYFMLGDNRDNSFDSRFQQVGFISGDALSARQGLIYFSAGPLGLNWGRMFRPVR